MRRARFVLSVLLLAGTIVTSQILPAAAAEQSAASGPLGAAPVIASNQTVAIGTYRAPFPNDLRSVDDFEQESGQKLALISWYAYWGGWKRDFSRTDLDLVSARGAVPLITWEPWAGQSSDPAWTLRGAILSGANDAYIESWARGLAAYGKPVLLRFAHEMHHQTYPWAIGVNGNTAEEYVAAWKHVHGIFARHNATNVKWVWNPNTMGDTLASTYDPLYRSLYPGDAYVDWLGLDIYNTGPELNWGAPYWRTFTQAMTEPYSAITRISDKPLLLGEVGSAETGGSKSDWLTSALTNELQTNFPRVRAFVWFDINKEENWTVESSSVTRSAWVSALRYPLFSIDGSHPIWGGAIAPQPTATATPTAQPVTATSTPVTTEKTAYLPVYDAWDDKSKRLLSQLGELNQVW